MLIRLDIRNYAIIEEISIQFSSGLNIITGETGAGKSILMGALSLILGDRADSSVLLDKENKCFVEGYFSVKNNESIHLFLQENELDSSDELIIRRELSPAGKSRAFINDTPVNLSQLKELSSLLVDLHQQFDTASLNDRDFQRDVLDSLAGNIELVKEYSLLFSQYNFSKKELEKLIDEQNKANATLDYHQFLFNELEDAGLKENELEELDAELKLLNNAENIKQALTSLYADLSEGEQPLNQQIKIISNKLQSLQSYHSGLELLNNRIKSIYVELQDIGDELQHISSGIHYSAERILIINEKISQGYKLLKKHNVQTTGELLQIKFDIEKKLLAHADLNDFIVKKQQEMDGLLKNCNLLAKNISTGRINAIKPFTEEVNQLLKKIGMVNARLKVSVTNTMLNKFGKDEIVFLFDANFSSGKEGSGGRFEPLHKVASGGELSRLMLCIKSLVAKTLHLPTLIFDEIDSGISGESAKQVGIIMKELSVSHQLIAITHQPQIASRADAHYFVYKFSGNKSMLTSLRLLNQEERVNAIAQMISGDMPTEAAIQHAKEMMSD